MKVTIDLSIWITQQQLATGLNVTRQRVHHWVKRKKIKQKYIPALDLVLINIKDVFKKMRNNELPNPSLQKQMRPEEGSFVTLVKARKHRKKNLMRYAYDTSKANALRRGHEFTISFEYFTKFCRETLYHMGKGRSKTSFTIDRIQNELGYMEGNIRCLSQSENSKKGSKTLSYDWETGYAVYL